MNVKSARTYLTRMMVLELDSVATCRYTATMLLRSIIALAVFATGTVSVSAAPILWTLQGVTFSDGGTAFGSFVYDADTNTYSNLDITTTTGSVRAGSTYTVFNPFVGNSASGFFAATTFPFDPGSPGLIIGFLGLTDSGGTRQFPLFSFSEGSYYYSIGLVGDATYRSTTTGGISSVPEPSALILVAIGGLVLIVLRSRADRGAGTSRDTDRLIPT